MRKHCTTVDRDVAIQGLTEFLPMPLILKTLCYTENLEVRLVNMDGKVPPRKEVRNMKNQGGGKAYAYMLSPRAAYRLIVTTKEARKKSDEWDFCVVEEPYGENVMCQLVWEKHDPYAGGPAILIIETEEKIYSACDPEHSIVLTGKHDEFLFSLSNTVAECDFCDISWLQVRLEKKSCEWGFCDYDDQEYMKTLPILLSHQGE